MRAVDGKQRIYLEWLEYLGRFNAVQDERQSVIKGLLVKMGVS